MNNYSFLFKLEEIDHDNDKNTLPKIKLVLERFSSENY